MISFCSASTPGRSAATFFPSDDPYASLMATFLSFAAGFAMRPIGALVLGPYIDRIGRRKGLIVTLSIMACGTILIAFVPGYATIGVLAPILVVRGRLLQGFSAGVELGGVSVYLSEMATPGNKGFYVSWQSASQQVAVVVAALLGYAIANLMTPEAAAGWGWRIPFFIGCAIVPFLYMIRRSLEETKAFAARKVHPTDAADLRDACRQLADRGRRRGDGDDDDGVVLSHHRLHADLRPGRCSGSRNRQSLLVTMAVAASNFVWLPISGAVSDRIGRKPILVAFTVLALLTAYPALAWLVRGADASTGCWRSSCGCRSSTPATTARWSVALTEVIPASVRTSGFSLAYSLATTLGGSSLLISTWLIQHTGDKAAPGYWMSFAALCGLIATLALYRRPARRGPVRAGRRVGRLGSRRERRSPPLAKRLRRSRHKIAPREFSERPMARDPRRKRRARSFRCMRPGSLMRSMESLRRKPTYPTRSSPFRTSARSR